MKQSEVKDYGDAGTDFIHTNNFVLVDTKKRIRGYYDGTKTEEVDQLMENMQQLIDEGIPVNSTRRKKLWRKLRITLITLILRTNRTAIS